jgi:hypothetical protein
MKPTQIFISVHDIARLSLSPQEEIELFTHGGK